MQRVQFLTVQELKDNSAVQSNLDEKVLNQCIIEFEDLELLPTLGKPLYQRLSNVLVSGATISGYTYTDNDTLLFEYIKPIMIYGALIYSLNPIHYKLSNKGIQKLTDDNAITGDGNDVSSVRAAYNTKLDGYKKRLMEYLKTDDDEDTNPPLNVDTSFNFTGIAIKDNQYNEDELYRNSAYKTGYYRRIIY